MQIIKGVFVERQHGKRLGLKNAFIWSWSDLKVTPQRAEVVVGEISEGSLPGTSYYINILSTAWMDAGGNAFPGVSDSTTLTFTTAG